MKWTAIVWLFIQYILLCKHDRQGNKSVLGGSTSLLMLVRLKTLNLARFHQYINRPMRAKVCKCCLFAAKLLQLYRSGMDNVHVDHYQCKVSARTSYPLKGRFSQMYVSAGLFKLKDEYAITLGGYKC